MSLGAKGVPGNKVEIDGDWILIKRTSSRSQRTHGHSEKHISIADVTALQFKKATFVENGTSHSPLSVLTSFLKDCELR
jgi:hypothetical protein